MAIKRLQSQSLDTSLLGDSSGVGIGTQAIPVLKPEGKPGPENGASGALLSPGPSPLCEYGLLHPAEGYLLNSQGTKLSKLCLSCAKRVISEQQEKLSPEEKEQVKLSLWSFERFEKGEEETEAERENKETLTESTPLSDLDESTRSLLSSLVSSYRLISAKIDSLTEDQKNTKKEIEEICLSLPSKRVTSPDWSTVRTRKSSSSFNKSKAISLCLERELDPIDFLDILSLSTEKKKGKEYIMITDVKKKGKVKE